MKMVNAMFSRNYFYSKCAENIGKAVEQEEKSCDEVEIVREFTYPDDSESSWMV